MNPKPANIIKNHIVWVRKASLRVYEVSAESSDLDELVILSGINPTSSGFLTISAPGGITPIISTIIPKNIQAEGQS